MRSTSLKCLFMTCVMMATLMFTANSVLAAKGKKQKTAPPDQNAAPAPAAAPSANTQAITSAQQELTTANSALQAVVQKAKTDFESSDEMTKAKQELAAAQAAYNAAAAPVLASLAANPDYKDALAQKQDASDKLTALRANGGDPPQDQVSELAQQEMTANSTVHSLQSTALTSDNAVVEAKTKLDAAQAAVTALRANFKKSLADNPEYVSAKKNVDDAQKKLSDAQSGTASAAG